MVDRSGSSFNSRSIVQHEPVPPGGGSGTSTGQPTSDPRLPVRSDLPDSQSAGVPRTVRDRDIQSLPTRHPRADAVAPRAITRLPDVLIGHIASFLPVGELVGATNLLTQVRDAKATATGSAVALKVAVAPKSVDVEELWQQTPAEHRSPDLVLEMIENEAIDSFDEIPATSLTPQTCLAAIKAQLARLDQVPEHLRDHLICTTAMKLGRALLSDVPIAVRVADRQLCETAISRHAGNLSDVPAGFHDDAMFDLVLEARPQALADLPASARTSARCERAVQKEASALEHVPDALKTKPMCDAAYLKSKLMFKHFPDNLKTQELCYDAVQSSYTLLDHVPTDKLDVRTYALAALNAGSYGPIDRLQAPLWGEVVAYARTIDASAVTSWSWPAR